MKKYLAIITAVTMLTLVGCATTNEADTSADTTGQTTPQTNTQTKVEDLSVNQSVSTEALTFPSEDYTKDLGESVTFSDGEEILITKSGTYEFTGDYTESTITVNVNKDIDDGIVYLVLNNANIESEAGTPINIIEAKDVIIVLDGENSVTQGEINTTDTEFPSSAIYSKADTVITGDGSLSVTTLYQDGINSRDDLIIDGGSITVNAVEDGIVGKDLLAISEATITIDAGKDGLKSSNDEDLDKGNIVITSGDFHITAENDAISSENILQIDGGEFELASGGGYAGIIKTPSSGGMGGGRGGFNPNTNTFDDESDDVTLDESMKALKATNNVIISGGTFNISAYEDAVHSDGDVTINGGEISINTGDDGVHANDTVNITNGTINIENCFEGIEGIVVNISGGDISINADDDGINASSSTGGVIISGGNIDVSFGQGGDGIDSNGTYTQTGGDIVITATGSSDAMNAPLDVDGTVTMSGGTIVDENGNAVEATGHGGGMRPSGNQGGMGGMRPSGNGAMPEGDVPQGFGGRDEQKPPTM